MTSPARTGPQRSNRDGRKQRLRQGTVAGVPRLFWYVATAVVAAFLIIGPVRHVLAPEFASWLWARDFEMYRDATARWLTGGPYYLPEQLNGPYPLVHGHVLYPPPSVLLFAPFTVLPAVLWWVIPLGVTAFVVARLRPHPSALPLILLAIGWPPTLVKLLTGNPVLWVLAAVAVSRLVPWASVMVLLKPSLFPFALLGMPHRSWWIALCALVLGSAVLAPVLPSWPEFVQVVRDARDPAGLLYSILEVPMLLIPILASRGRTRPPAAAETTPT